MDKGRKRKTKVKPAQVVPLTDNSGIKITGRFEYFDDRFYTVVVKNTIHDAWLKNIPDKCIDRDYGNGEYKIWLPSVTTILGVVRNRQLEKWRGDVGNSLADDISTAGKVRGSIIHNAIDLASRGTDIIYRNPMLEIITDEQIKKHKKKTHKPVFIVESQEVMVQVARYAMLLDILQPEVRETEQSVISLQHCFGGTIDQVWYLKGGSYKINSDRTETKIEEGLYLVDFKSGKHYDELATYTQLGTYAKSMTYLGKIKGCIGIHLNNSNKSGLLGVKVYVLPGYRMEKYFDRFIWLRNEYLMNHVETPKDYEVPLLIQLPKKYFISNPQPQNKQGEIQC